MSGGSFNYLGDAQDLEDLFNKTRDLDAMADTLAHLGYAPDAAAETRELLADLRAANVRAEAATRRLADVWRAAEWWKSNDSGEAEVHTALADYRAGTRQTPEAEQPHATLELDTPADRDAIRQYSTSPRAAAEAIRNLENEVFNIRTGILKRLDSIEEAAAVLIKTTAGGYR